MNENLKSRYIKSLLTANESYLCINICIRMCWCLDRSKLFRTVTFSLGPGPNRTLAKLAAWVMNKHELSTWVWFQDQLPTHLNRVSCQWVHQLSHMRILFVQCVNSILSKLCFQQPTIRVRMFCSVRYWLICDQCVSFDILYFSLTRRSIIVSCA